MSVSLVKSAEMPSVDAWLKEAKADPSAAGCGMYLTHNGVVRETAKAKVRLGAEDTKPVTGLFFSYEEEKVEAAIAAAYEMPGISWIRKRFQYSSHRPPVIRYASLEQEISIALSKPFQRLVRPFCCLLILFLLAFIEQADVTRRVFIDPDDHLLTNHFIYKLCKQSVVYH